MSSEICRRVFKFEDLGERVRMSRSSVLSALILAGKGRAKTITEDSSVRRSNARAFLAEDLLFAIAMESVAISEREQGSTNVRIAAQLQALFRVSDVR